MYTIFREHKTTDSEILEIGKNTSKIILYNKPDDYLYEKQFSEKKPADHKFVDQCNIWCSGSLKLP